MDLGEILLGETHSRQQLAKPVLNLFVLERPLGKAVGAADRYPASIAAWALSLSAREFRNAWNGLEQDAPV